MSKIKGRIGNPFNLEHKVSVRFNLETGTLDGLPDEWKKMLNEGANRDTLKTVVPVAEHIQNSNYNFRNFKNKKY